MGGSWSARKDEEEVTNTRRTFRVPDKEQNKRKG